MADSDPPDELSASAAESLPWPDPSRPIINERPQYGQPPPYVGGPGGPERRVPRPDRKFILPALLLLMAILVVVWLLWWR